MAKQSLASAYVQIIPSADGISGKRHPGTAALPQARGQRGRQRQSQCPPVQRMVGLGHVAGQLIREPRGHAGEGQEFFACLPFWKMS